MMLSTMMSSRTTTMSAVGSRPVPPSRAAICPGLKQLDSVRTMVQGRKQAGGLVVRADYEEENGQPMIREWPYPEFVAEVIAAFPDKAIATVEEARVLFSNDGYAYLDVRPTLELEEVGRVKGSVNIPLYTSIRKYDKEKGEKVCIKTENEGFKDQIKKAFPNTDAKILVACSDGRAYSMEALEALDEMGYTNLVGLKGGYYAWFKVFDNKLNRRRATGEYAETYTHDGDSCGIHSSGAGFEKVDAIEQWVPPKF